MLEFKWDGDELVITRCDKMKSTPQECNTCEHRFVCFTERIEPNNIKITSAKIPKLSDMLKELENVDRTTDN